MTLATLTELTDEQVLRALEGTIKSHRVRCALLPILLLRDAIQNGEDHAASR
jgi:hypothetical protein